jgi:hypothetical protein
MDRRAFLATSAAAGAMLATTRGAIAETERPAGETGVVLPASSEAKLPLGVLPNTRYPDTHIESLDKRFKGSVGTGAVERVATGFRWAEGPAYSAAGRYLIFSDIPNNACSKMTTTSASFARRHTTPTATRLTPKAGWSVASMPVGASCAQNTTAPLPWLLIATTVSGSIRPTMDSCLQRIDLVQRSYVRR